MGITFTGTSAADTDRSAGGDTRPRSISVRYANFVAVPELIVARHYRLKEPVNDRSGERGTDTARSTASVWRAEHLGEARQVALKFLDPTIGEDAELLDSFFWEARTAAAISNQHVAHILDYGIESGTPYLVTEWLEGETLEMRLRRQCTLGAAQLDRMFGETAQALDEAHELGVIHRDLKPSNLFLSRGSERETTKVIFGIAKIMNDTLALVRKLARRASTPRDSVPPETIAYQTVAYSSPEQVLGKTTLDKRSDLWSLSVIAFECLTGKLPFSGRTLGDRLVEICTGSASAPSQHCAVPPGFDEWFARGVSKVPRERFASALQMADALTAVLAR
jgi:eukaryotic-like serine/threonine-protein kinase